MGLQVNSFFSMLENSLRQIDSTSMIRDVPDEYRKTTEESYASRSVFACRVAENASVRHMSEARAARTATQC